jgi:hypothetical protein
MLRVPPSRIVITCPWIAYHPEGVLDHLFGLVVVPGHEPHASVQRVALGCEELIDGRHAGLPRCGPIGNMDDLQSTLRHLPANCRV